MPKMKYNNKFNPLSFIKQLNRHTTQIQLPEISANLNFQVETLPFTLRGSF